MPETTSRRPYVWRNPADVDSLAALIREASPMTRSTPEGLAEEILGNWGLLFNYEQVVDAARSLGVHPEVRPDPQGVERLKSALAPFEED